MLIDFRSLFVQISERKTGKQTNSFCKNNIFLIPERSITYAKQTRLNYVLALSHSGPIVAKIEANFANFILKADVIVKN